MTVRQRLDSSYLTAAGSPTVILFSIYNNTPHSVLFHFLKKILNSGFKKFCFSEVFIKLRIIPENMKSIQKTSEQGQLIKFNINWFNESG